MGDMLIDVEFYLFYDNSQLPATQANSFAVVHEQSSKYCANSMMKSALSVLLFCTVVGQC